MTFADRIRHPSGALNPPQSVERKPNRILWLLFFSVVVIVIGWRMGWFGKAVASVSPVSNPRGWV